MIGDVIDLGDDAGHIILIFDSLTHPQVRVPDGAEYHSFHISIVHTLHDI